MNELADAERHAQLRRFGSIPMEIEVELYKTTLTVAELLELRPGSVIRTKRSPDSTLTLRTGGAGLAKGQLSMRLGRRVVRITAISQGEVR
jgi:flagellar motor switch/type III secretory pathway protein FliN